MNREADLELMASALYRLVEQKLWTDAPFALQQNYLAVCRDTVDSVKDEHQRQQPEAGQKAGAA